MAGNITDMLFEKNGNYELVEGIAYQGNQPLAGKITGMLLKGLDQPELDALEKDATVTTRSLCVNQVYSEQVLITYDQRTDTNLVRSDQLPTVIPRKLVNPFTQKPASVVPP